jgi:hypothetical protein
MILLIFVGVIERELRKFTKMQNLKGMIWNGGGFGDTANIFLLKNLLGNTHLISLLCCRHGDQTLQFLS